MPDLEFKVEKVEPEPYAASPLLNFTLRVTDADPEAQTIHAVVLRCQIRIDPARRKYQPAEKERLRDLFGEPSRWGQTMRSMLWTHANVTVPIFTGSSSTVTLPVPCTYDFNVAMTKFFNALDDGEVPLTLLFSGTIFHATEDHSLQVMQIPWEKETTFRLPVSIWKQMMEIYYPNSAWLCLHKDAFDRLLEFKTRRGLPTWEAAIEKLLDHADEEAPT